MQDITDILNQAEETCHANGTRLTTKRKHVLACLLQARRAQSAYDLIDGVKDEFGDTMQPTTMYRILEFLEGEELVHKLHLANKYVPCSHIRCDHRHEIPQFLICSTCDRVEEIGVSKNLVDSLKASVKDAGYTLVSPQLELHCLCGDCAAMAA